MLERIVATTVCITFFSVAAFGEETGAQSPAGLLEQVTKISADDAAPVDWFGYSVALDGDLAVVGAPRDDDAGSESGSAYLFRRDPRDSNTWDQVTKLTASDASSEDRFGFAVAISGDRILIGAYWDDDAGSQSGSAYIFERDHGGPNAWGQVAKLTAQDGFIEDWFGYAVSIHGDTAVVGAFGNDDLGSVSGSVYMFERDHGGPNTWGQVTKLTAADGAAGDGLGWSVSIRGDTVIAGAPGDDVAIPDGGSAYLFGRNVGGPNNWGQLTKITASTLLEDSFGGSVSIHEGTVIVGAYDHSGVTGGAAYLFGRDHGGSDAWGQLARLTATDAAPGDRFGLAVSLHGNTAVVGADLRDDGGVDRGSIYVFERDAGGPGAWGQLTKLTAPDAESGDRLGVSVAVDSQTVLAGAFLDDASGSAYAFAPTPSPNPTLVQDPLVHGGTVDFRVTGAEPGERVLFLASLVGLGPGPCYPRLGGLCVDLLQPSPIGRATADASGVALLTRTLPLHLSVGQEVSTQAVIRRGPGDIDSVKSNTVTSTVE